MSLDKWKPTPFGTIYARGKWTIVLRNVPGTPSHWRLRKVEQTPEGDVWGEFGSFDTAQEAAEWAEANMADLMDD